jgi:hypothetical protein
MIKIPTSKNIFGSRAATMKAAELDLSEYIAFSVKTGLKCKIMNGSVCDVNGVPFQNKSLQDEASFFTERVSNSKTVVLGTIVPASAITYSFSDIAEIEAAMNSNAKRHADVSKSYSIEIYDFSFELEPETISYGTKRMMLYSMSRSSTNEGFIYTSTSIFGESLTKESFTAFMLTNAYSGKKTALYQRMSSDTSKKFAERFIINPFEVLSRPIIGYDKFSGTTDFQERTKVITVSFDTYELKIPMIRVSKKWARYLLMLLDEKIITSFTFKAIFDINENKYKCAVVL